MHALTITWIVGLALLPLGCGRAPAADVIDGGTHDLATQGSSGSSSAASSSTGSSIGTGASANVASAIASTLIERMPDAPFNVHFEGTRELVQTIESGGQRIQHHFQEKVGADGSGKFAIEAELLSGPQDPEIFALKQLPQQGHNYRQRDFRIRDLQLFRQSYQLTMTDADVPIAGINCVEFQVGRNDGSPAHYTVHVDPSSALVLRSEERDATGVVVARMEYSSIEYGADLSDMVLTDGRMQREELDVNTLIDDSASTLGFEMRIPTLPAPGFELDTATHLTDPAGRHWLKLSYLDGVEVLTFMHRAQNVPAPGSLDQVSSGEATVITLGNLVVVSGEIDRTGFVITGRALEDDLLTMVGSALATN